MSESTPAECPDVNWLAVRMVPAYARKADNALYLSKKSGRNRVSVEI